MRLKENDMDDADHVVVAIAAIPLVYRAEIEEVRCGYPTTHGGKCGMLASSEIHLRTAEECGCNFPAEHHPFAHVGATMVVAVELR